MDDSGTIATITLASPKNLNVLTTQLISELIGHLAHLETQEKLKVLILNSSVKKAFCAGANIKEFEKNTYASRLLGVNYLRKLQVAFHEFKKVVIVAVNGLALGGGFELALLGDLILATEDARFGFPEIKLGVFPGMRGTLIAKTVGRYRASRMIFTGEMVSAREMHQAGRIYSKSN